MEQMNRNTAAQGDGADRPFDVPDPAPRMKQGFPPDGPRVDDPDYSPMPEEVTVVELSARPGLRMLHTEKSGPAFTIARRNAAIASLVEPMARILYRAMQIQALGTIDFVLFEDLPVRAKEQLIADARTALHLQSSLYRELAERKAKHTFHDALKDAAYHYPVLNPCADHREQDRRAEAMTHVATFMELLDIPALMLGVYKRALAELLPSGPTAQVMRTALRGVTE